MAKKSRRDEHKKKNPEKERERLERKRAKEEAINEACGARKPTPS